MLPIIWCFKIHHLEYSMVSLTYLNFSWLIYVLDWFFSECYSSKGKWSEFNPRGNWSQQFRQVGLVSMLKIVRRVGSFWQVTPNNEYFYVYPWIFSVVVKEDKKLLTVLFPDGRDGRAFTLKVPLFLIALLFSVLNSFIIFLLFIVILKLSFHFPKRLIIQEKIILLTGLCSIV